jgi:hypothetical protein
MGEPQSIAPAPKRVVETEEYVAALARFIDGYGRRVGEDPAAIAYFQDLQKRLTDAVNVGLATAHKRKGGWSLRDLGRYMGTSHVAALKRVKQGMAIISRREAAAGVVRLADAAKPSVPALRQQRADYLAEIGEEDYRPLRIVRKAS